MEVIFWEATPDLTYIHATVGKFYACFFFLPEVKIIFNILSLVRFLDRGVLAGKSNIEVDKNLF